MSKCLSLGTNGILALVDQFYDRELEEIIDSLFQRNATDKPDIDIEMMFRINTYISIFTTWVRPDVETGVFELAYRRHIKKDF